MFEGEDAIFTCSPLIPIAVPLLEQDGFVVIRATHPRISFVDNGGLSEGNRTYTLREVERSDNGTWFRCSVAGFPSNNITVIVYSEFNLHVEHQDTKSCRYHWYSSLNLSPRPTCTYNTQFTRNR